MPALKIDFVSTELTGRGTESPDGTPWFDDVIVVPVCIPVDQVDLWLTAYDSDNQYSPSAADSRQLARAVLDAVKKHQE